VTEKSVRDAVLSGLDQLEALLAEVRPERFDDPTPCAEWTVRDLVDHVVEAPANFATMMRGEEVDWSSTPRHDDWLAAYRRGADELRSQLPSAGEVPPMAGFQAAEFAVHSWDLARALGRGTSDLDPWVAECGFEAMRGALTPERRGSAFGPEQQAPADADIYERIAAFSGRSVGRG